jgi:restriction system protein
LKTNEFIDGTQLSLEEWLCLLNDNKDKVFPNNYFPTEDMLEEYLSTIDKRSDEEVKNIIRHFLTYSDFLDLDREYQLEGITWILNLLPYYPIRALETLKSYFIVHMGSISQAFIYGIEETMILICAKFMEHKEDIQELRDLNCNKLAWLVAEIYTQMGYYTEIISETPDGGVDIIAMRAEGGKREKLLIRCKGNECNITSRHIEETVKEFQLNEETKIVFVTSSNFSNETKELPKEYGYLELLDIEDLGKLLNLHLGDYWNYRLENIFFYRELEDDETLSAW